MKNFCNFPKMLSNIEAIFSVVKKLEGFRGTHDAAG
jgi:hypothetical protein